MTAVRTIGAAFCPRCGVGCPPAARFCPGCGLDLSGVVLPAPGAPPATAPWAPAAGLPLASATGRRASRAGWVLAVLGGLAFLVAAVGIIVAAGGFGSHGPPATWDRMLTDPATIADGESFDIEIGAVGVGVGAGTTDPLWIIIDWRPDDRALDPDAVGRLVACAPTDCRYRDDAVGGRTVVYWPGLAAGERRTYVVTARVTGIESGTTFSYRVATGTGPDEGAIAGGRRWSLDAEVR